MNAASRSKGLLFKQVYEDLCKRIQNAEFPPGSQLPTEVELIRQYQVSITTIRKAVQILADKNIISKKQGQGTFVLKVPAIYHSPADSSFDNGREKENYRIAVFLPKTKLKVEGDSRHWTLNVRRLNGIYAAAARSGISVFVYGFGETVDVEHFHGVICMPSYAYDLSEDDLRQQLVRHLELLRKPFVTISEFDPRFSAAHWITELTESEFFSAVRYLLDRDLKRIALIGPDLHWENPRYTGYRKALKYAGVAFDEKNIVENPLSDSASAYRACEVLQERFGGMGEMLASLDAILCTTDLQAYGVLEYLKERGIRVPEQISLMGVDNLPESANLPIPLTSVEFSGQEVGEQALALLQDVIRGKYPGGITVSYHGKICERATVKQLK